MLYYTAIATLIAKGEKEVVVKARGVNCGKALFVSALAMKNLGLKVKEVKLSYDEVEEVIKGEKEKRIKPVIEVVLTK